MVGAGVEERNVEVEEITNSEGNAMAEACVYSFSYYYSSILLSKIIFFLCIQKQCKTNMYT